jgi:hypothetical protein
VRTGGWAREALLRSFVFVLAVAGQPHFISPLATFAPMSSGLGERELAGRTEE